MSFAHEHRHAEMCTELVVKKKKVLENEQSSQGNERRHALAVFFKDAADLRFSCVL